MTALLLAVKPSAKVHPTSEKPALESLIAVPSRTPSGLRVCVEGDQIVVKSKMATYIAAQLVAGNVLSVLWLSINWDFALLEYVVPFVHIALFAAMINGRRLNVYMALNMMTWMFITTLLCDRTLVATPHFARVSFWEVMDTRGAVFNLFTWPLMRIFFLWTLSMNTFLFGCIKLQCIWDAENVRQMVRRQTDDASDLV